METLGERIKNKINLYIMTYFDLIPIELNEIIISYDSSSEQFFTDKRELFTKKLNWEIISNYHFNKIKEEMPMISNSREYFKYINIEILRNKLKNISNMKGKSLGEIYNLKELDIIGRGIKELPSEIGELDNLEGLMMRVNNLSYLPPGIVNLHNLKFLDLDNNCFAQFPKEIGSLLNLEILYLANNEKKEISIDKLKLKKLTHLDLRKNQLKQLPDGISNLKNLESLDLDEFFYPQRFYLKQLLPNTNIYFK